MTKSKAIAWTLAAVFAILLVQIYAGLTAGRALAMLDNKEDQSANHASDKREE